MWTWTLDFVRRKVSDKNFDQLFPLVRLPSPEHLLAGMVYAPGGASMLGLGDDSTAHMVLKNLIYMAYHSHRNNIVLMTGLYNARRNADLAAAELRWRTSLKQIFHRAMPQDYLCTALTCNSSSQVRLPVQIAFAP